MRWFAIVVIPLISTCQSGRVVRGGDAGTGGRHQACVTDRDCAAPDLCLEVRGLLETGRFVDGRICSENCNADADCTRATGEVCRSDSTGPGVCLQPCVRDRDCFAQGICQDTNPRNAGGEACFPNNANRLHQPCATDSDCSELETCIEVLALLESGERLVGRICTNRCGTDGDCRFSSNGFPTICRAEMTGPNTCLQGCTSDSDCFADGRCQDTNSTSAGGEACFPANVSATPP